MPPFDLEAVGEEEERYYAAWRADDEWRQAYAFLNRDLWHVTSESNWKKIKKHGAIAPNSDGKFESGFGEPRKCYANENGLVALFDFQTAGEVGCIRAWEKVSTVLGTHDPAVLLRLDRGALDSKLIPNSKVWDAEKRRPIVWKHFIGFCEVWYPTDISIAVVTGTYRLRNGKRKFSPEAATDLM